MEIAKTIQKTIETPETMACCKTARTSFDRSGYEKGNGNSK